jgi:hypothetical protein
MLDNMGIITHKLPPHGSPADRGAADAYYGRAPRPHKYEGGSVLGLRIGLHRDGDAVEYKEYMDAFMAEDDRKDW